MPPLVSIITPAWNAARYLPETYVSLAAQTLKDWEWIVIDDGSTDDTNRVLREIAAADSRVVVRAMPDHTGHVAKVRNEAMRRAEGEFIAFLDADDVWLPRKLELQIEHMRRHPDLGVLGTFHEYFGDPARTRLLQRMLSHPRHLECRTSDFILGCPFKTPTVMIRRSMLDDGEGFDEDPRLVVGEDFEFFARLSKRLVLHRLPMVLVRVRLSPPATSLSTHHDSSTNQRGWTVFQVLKEKGIFSKTEQRRRIAVLYYDQARDNLLIHRSGFRVAILKSVVTLHPPVNAIVFLFLSFLPARVLRDLLPRLHALRCALTRTAMQS